MGRTKRKDHRGFDPKGRGRHQSGINERIWEEKFGGPDEAFFDTDDRPSSYPRDASDVDLSSHESVRSSRPRR